MTRTVVMWFRRDLRLADLPALQAAAADGANVVPLFVVDPTFARAGLARRAFMAEALQALDDSVGRCPRVSPRQAFLGGGDPCR